MGTLAVRMQACALLLGLAIIGSVSARSPYIVGGHDVATAGKWPWQASLRYEFSHWCGASLISDTWLVTASHCADNPDIHSYQVTLGQHDRETEKQGKPSRYPVKKIIMHPEYVPNSRKGYPNDIALVQLSRPAKLSQYVQPIDMADGSEDFVGNPDCYITGWGSTSGDAPLANVLQELHIDIYPEETCRTDLKRLGDWHLCGGNVKAGACYGDSGGPMVCKDNGTWKLAGAISFVFGNCSTRQPTYFTNVGYFREWVKQNTGA